MRMSLALALLVLAAATLGAAPAGAETVNCTAINTLPAVISTQGLFCLTQNLSTAITSGSAISITTNNVVLDLNGFKIGGLAGGVGTTAVGVGGTGRANVTIKNGTIRGFLRGVYLDGASSQGHVVEDVRADQNTYAGIWVVGTGHIVRNNQVVTTGGTTTFGANANAYGIYAEGAGPRIINNDVIETTEQGTGVSVGINLASSTGAMVVNNRITDADRGIDFSTGPSTGKYRDNLTFSVTTPFTGGTDAGNNN